MSKVTRTGAYTLTSTMNGSSRAASYATEEDAMEAAIGWVEDCAETWLQGDLRRRYARARAWWCGQGGTMEVIVSSSP